MDQWESFRNKYERTEFLPVVSKTYMMVYDLINFRWHKILVLFLGQGLLFLKDFKIEVANKVGIFIKNIQDKFYKYRNDEKHLKEVLEKGASKAHIIATKKRMK